MINYNASPTGDAFLASRAFMKGICGPIGCLPANSEFLTPTGWKRMDAYEPGDQVGVWAEGAVRFEAAEFVDLPAQEAFYRFDSGSLVMELSPQHRVAHYDWAGQFKVITAEKMAARPSKRTIPTTFTLERPDAPMTDDELRLRVAFAADGHTRQAGFRDRITLRKERKKVRLRQLLSALDIEWHEREAPDRPTETRFSFDARHLHLAKDLEFVWGLSSRQLALVAHESTLWDGLAENAELRFTTSRRAEADAIQFAAHASGRRASVRTTQDARNPHHAPMHTVHIRTSGGSRNRACVRCDTTKITRTQAPDGRMYCFHTSTGFFVARHEGTVFVTGNSGKSTVALMDLLQRSVMQEPFNGVRRTKHGILRNTMPQLRSTVKPLIDTWFVTLAMGRMGRWRTTDNTFEVNFIAGDGTEVFSEFVLLPADTPDDVRRLLSLELSSAWVEEAREVDPEVFAGLQGRVNRYPSRAAGGVTYPGIIFSTNPPALGTFWHETITRPPSNALVLTQPPALLDDGRINPEAENLENLADDYYDNLIEGKTSEWIDVYLKNKFGQGNVGRPVFKASFKRSFHVAKEALLAVSQSVNPLVVGMDNGLQAAATMTQRDLRGRVNVLSDCYVPEDTTMGVESFLDRLLIPHLRAKYPQFRNENILFRLDPACFQRSQVNEKTIAQAVQERGFTALRAPTNDPERRVQSVEGLLATQVDGAAGLLIDPGCTHLIDALEWGYRYKNSTVGALTFEKNHASHQAESLQYACLHYHDASVREMLGRGKRREVKPAPYRYV